MRRAIDAYAVHLERLMLLPDQHDDPTRDRELAQGVERMRLREMHGDRDLGVPEGIACGVPLRPLSEHVKERSAGRTPEHGLSQTIKKPIDVIRRELSRGMQEDDDDALCA
jgi:hypothetical protein